MTLCAANAHPIEEKVTIEYKVDQERKYDQKINRTKALAHLINMNRESNRLSETKEMMKK